MKLYQANVTQPHVLPTLFPMHLVRNKPSIVVGHIPIQIKIFIKKAALIRFAEMLLLHYQIKMIFSWTIGYLTTLQSLPELLSESLLLKWLEYCSLAIFLKTEGTTITAAAVLTKWIWINKTLINKWSSYHCFLFLTCSDLFTVSSNQNTDF